MSDLDVIIPCDPAPDVIFTWMSECLVQDRVLQVFEAENVTGFSTRPARGRIGQTGVPVALTKMLVTGWGGIVTSRVVEVCRKYSITSCFGAEFPDSFRPSHFRVLAGTIVRLPYD